MATLGINPSPSEFLGNGALLTGLARRLATLSSLGAMTNTALTDLQVQTVVAECATYFHRRPYTRWFGVLDGVLRAGLHVSYFEDTACHLDLVPWATEPAWSELPAPVRQRLLADEVPHPVSQLERENVRLVVVNGKAVWDQLAAIGVATFEDVGVMPYSNVGGATTTLRIGSGGSTRFVGWTRNLQARPGATRSDRRRLADWLGTAAHDVLADEVAPSDRLNVVTGGPEAKPIADDIAPADMLNGVTVRSKAELVELLRAWYEVSDNPTIGAVGSYGRRPLVTIEIGGRRAVLNADTKRSAVRAVLDIAVDVRPWRVVANRNGVWNRVDVRPDGPALPGWYCYLTEPTDGPAAL